VGGWGGLGRSITGGGGSVAGEVVFGGFCWGRALR